MQICRKALNVPLQKIKVGEKCCVKKPRAVGYKVIELAKFTEDMKKEFYLVGESLLGNNAKKCNAQNVWNELSPTRSQCRKKLLICRIIYFSSLLSIFGSWYSFSPPLDLTRNKNAETDLHHSDMSLIIILLNGLEDFPKYTS